MTYKGKPIFYGDVTLQTLWESEGAIHKNPRIHILKKDKLVRLYPFYLLRQAMDYAIKLSFQKADERQPLHD